MTFLKDNKNIILGYDKTSERGDINFIDTSEPKISDFYYNKLQGGLGGISCFEDGRFVIAADKKGVFAFVDLSKGPNIDDIKANSIQTIFEGVLDISLSPFQTKLACGMTENKCFILDLGKERMKTAPSLSKKLSGHIYSVNCINWHPFKSLILSSSLDIHDNIKLWDPYTEQLVQEVNFHSNATVTKTLFHPVGNTFFSIGKDNTVFEYEIRFRGYLNKFKLEHEPTALEIMHNGNLVIGDSSGSLNWYNPNGKWLKRIEGNSGVVMMASDWSKSILAVAR
jgi:WD40 repeat protein